MSIANKKKLEKKSTSISGVIYTICPVLVASHIAVENGWLKEELKKVGTNLKYLRSLPKADWLPHFNHRLPNLFRDGGNIPAIWTKSEGVDTKLVGLTFSGNGGQILVRVNSGINRVKDLKGRKIGLSKGQDLKRIDFWRATAERGIFLALGNAGIKKEDVEIIDLPEPDYAIFLEPAQKPAELWGTGKSNSLFRAEVKALLEGKVDAIYSNHGRSIALEAEGAVKVIEDLGKYPDWTLQVANSPYTITVNSDLAEKHPEIVVAYLRAALKAGTWINNHPSEAGEIFTKVTSFPCGACAAKELQEYDLVPKLSGKNIAGLEVEKKFLLEHGYIKNDFDVREWVDTSFLEEALEG